MPNERTASQPIKGTNKDLHISKLDETSYTDSLNATIESFDGNNYIIQNEGSNILCTGFPAGYKVVGFGNIIEQSRIIWLLSDGNGNSEIGETQHFENCRQYAKDGIIKGVCDNCEEIKLSEKLPLEKITQKGCCTYRTIKNQTCFNFDVKYPVLSFEYNILPCRLQIFFTNAREPRRHLEFEYVDADPNKALTVYNKFLEIVGFNTPPCEDPVYGENIDCNKMNLQPVIETPCIDFIDLVSGGSNKAGSYQFFAAHSNVEGEKLSSYFSSTEIIPIRTRDITLDTDYVTDKAIVLDIHNLDERGAYEYYILAVAKTINGNTAFYKVGTFPVTQSRVVYTGNNKSEIVLDPQEIFQRLPYYKTASSVTKSNGVLFWAGLKGFNKINVQRITNNVILQWQTIAIPEAAYLNARNTNKYRSEQRDEVIAAGLQFIMDNGEETAVGHVPGREAISSDTELVSGQDVFLEDNCATDDSGSRPRWQVYNTGTVIGGDLEIYKECEETCYQYGNFAYWESIRRYPNIPEIYGALCGKQIRHHRFPDCRVTHIHNRENDTAEFKQNNLVFPIGFKINHDSVRAAIATAVAEGALRQEDADRIVGYRLVRGNRFGNKSIIAKGLLYDVNQYVRFNGATPIDQEPTYFANYPYNDLHDDHFITNELDNYKDHNTPRGNDLPFVNSKRFTFHGPDTHFSEPSIGTELKLETVEYGQSEGYFTKCKQQAKQKLLSNTSYFLALTGGVVAALLRTEERICTEYTVKSDYTVNQKDDKYKQDAFTITSNWSVSGSSPYGNVSATLDLGTGEIMTTEASGSYSGTGDGSSDVPEVNTTQTHGVLVQHNHHTNDDQDDNNLQASKYTWDEGTGAAGTAKDNTGTAIDDAKFETITSRTCTGVRHQYFNGLTATSLNNMLPGLGTVVSTIFTIIGKAEDYIRIALEEMKIILDLIKSFTPYRDWTVQYNSVGKYNNFIAVQNTGNKRRLIKAWQYLKPENTIVREEVDFTTGNQSSIKFNNWHRESSLYLKYDGVELLSPSGTTGVVDASRPSLPDIGCTLDKKAYRNICSYYASLKRNVPDQYGSIYDIEYLPTDSCEFKIDALNSDCRGVYGGDTFITRFALKRKLPFFLATTFKLPAGTDWDYSEWGNVAYPRNYYNTTNTLGSEFTGLLSILQAIDIVQPNIMFDLYGRPKSIRDCDTNKLFYQNGYIYLYSYGIPYFLVESDINTDYRHGENLAEKAYYPGQQDLNYWLQEENVPISEDNFYAYNRDYSKQNKETPLTIYPADFKQNCDCCVDYKDRIIYATDNNWLTYKENDKFDFTLNKGRITSVEGVENDTVFVRTTNGTSIFKSILRTQVEGQTVAVGNGGIFANPPQDFANTKLGYMGSQHKAVIHSEFGHIWADAKRGNVFNVAPGASSVEEIGKDGMKAWFKENLPFRILRDFPNMPEEHADNSFLGVGLAMVFDKKNNRFFLSKLDYESINKNLEYNPDTKVFTIGPSGTTEVVLGDKRYFKDKSWTWMYSFETKSWISPFSWKPNYYIDFIESFGAGDKNGFWLHNLTNSSFQVFFGVLHPFFVEPIVKFGAGLKILNNLEYDVEVRRYQNEWDYAVKKTLPGFNKAIIFNDIYNSGMLNLVKVDKDNMSIGTKYPVRNSDNWEVELSLVRYKWRINQFYNMVKDHADIPLWIFAGNNLDKSLNQAAFNYKKADINLSRIRGQWFKTRFINDKDSNHKILFKFSIANENETKS